ncbi:WAC protein, partial [Polypterus senegalus]
MENRTRTKKRKKEGIEDKEKKDGVKGRNRTGAGAICVGKQVDGKVSLRKRNEWPTLKSGLKVAHVEQPMSRSSQPLQEDYCVMLLKRLLDFAKLTLKYPSKSHPGTGDHRHEKMRDTGDPTPPCKMLRRSDSPDNKYSDGTGHSKAKTGHAHRGRERDGGTSYSPQENSHNHSTLHSSNSHSSNPGSNSSKTEAPYEPADDWSEHISSSGKKYYYNCRTEVSQWEKPKEWLEREQRQKEGTTKVAVNIFPKDRDYRREAIQATAASGFSSGSKYKI